ncbi:Canalicular multispecific organic anion transporter 2, partial [Actinomortierella wolfii]
MPSRILTATSYSRISAIWKAHVAQHPTNPSLLKVIIKWGGLAWIPMIVADLIHTTFSYCTPMLLGELISFVGSYSGDESKAQPVSLGLILAFALFFSSLFSTMADGQEVQLAINLGAELRTGLISLIYRKALVLSSGARQTMTVGEISNRMAVDCERVASALRYITLALVLPIDLGIGIWLVYVKLGWCSLVGLGVLVLTSPAQTALGRIMNKQKDQKLGAMDNRIRLMNEILSGIKITKLYGWEDSFRKRIKAIREIELKASRKIGTVMAFMMIMFTSLPSLMTLASLTVYAIVGGPGFTRGEITAEKIFVTVSLFNRLSVPIGQLSQISTQLISLNVASKRIRDYLLAEEIDESTVIRLMTDNIQASDSDLEKSFGEDASIVVKGGHFAWVPELEPEVAAQANKEKRSTNMKDEGQNEKGGSSTPISTDPTLIDINLRVPQGSLTIMVGRVGQGKSSLISALMGEMYKRQGTVYLKGTTGYVPQQAWIFNATLKDNIVFGMPFDQDKYDRIVSACGLKPDFDMLPAGDMTEIGERGINLSGGQKQRISLARAAYQEADVYLLDDPLSAVDAHVDQHLWKNLIGPNGLLKDKTRLLVTHGIHHLSEADQIIVLKDGRIIESGQYNELMDLNGVFFQLIQEYSISSQSTLTRVNDPMTRDQLEPINNRSSSITQLEGKAKIDPQTSLGTNETEYEQSWLQKTEDQPLHNDDDENAKLIQEEEMMTGNVGWRVFMTYARA